LLLITPLADAAISFAAIAALRHDATLIAAADAISFTRCCRVFALPADATAAAICQPCRRHVRLCQRYAAFALLPLLSPLLPPPFRALFSLNISAYAAIFITDFPAAAAAARPLRHCFDTPLFRFRAGAGAERETLHSFIEHLLCSCFKSLHSHRFLGKSLRFWL